MSQKYRSCNPLCPGYVSHQGSWCGYYGHWGKQVKTGSACFLKYAPLSNPNNQNLSSKLEQKL